MLWPRPVPRASGALPNDAYIWQRSWTEPLNESIHTHGSNFAELVVLAAEVSWKNHSPQVARVPLQVAAFQQSSPRLGLALRIGSYPGPFREDDAQARFLAELAAGVVAEAVTNHLALAELQIDFDCAESKLDGYATWLRAIRQAVDPVPVTITALPSWLKRPAFKDLVQSMNHYVLQVHSLERPRGVNDSFELCNPAKAREAVERAARLGTPFQVALPTYGYLVAFNPAGRFLGLSAEGPAPNWPAETRLREVRSHPERMAELVRAWSVDHPRALTGIIWYRLPVAGERLNWSWPTLASVMSGTVPQAALRAEVRRHGSPLLEIDAVNSGTADDLMPQQVTLSWQEGEFVAGDGLQGFELAEASARNVRFQLRNSQARLQPGERRPIGWVRFRKETEVQVEVPERKGAL